MYEVHLGSIKPHEIRLLQEGYEVSVVFSELGQCPFHVQKDISYDGMNRILYERRRITQLESPLAMTLNCIYYVNGSGYIDFAINSSTPKGRLTDIFIQKAKEWTLFESDPDMVQLIYDLASQT